MSDYPVPDISEFDLIQILRALGDPIRLDIVTALADGEPHQKRTGTWGAGLTKSTVSHHFRVLREAGLTRTLVDGRTHSCQLRRAELDERFPGLIEALTRDGGRQPDAPAASHRSEVIRDHFARTPPADAAVPDPDISGSEIEHE